MQTSCADHLKTARDLLDYGILPEGAEKLAKLHDCGRQAGCAQWNRCIGLVENMWLAPSSERKPGSVG